MKAEMKDIDGEQYVKADYFLKIMQGVKEVIEERGSNTQREIMLIGYVKRVTEFINRAKEVSKV